MPGYEPFLLCDFHVHTHWSDGRLSRARSRRSVRPDRPLRRHRDHRSHPDEVATCWRAPARMASLGRREFSVTADRSSAISPTSPARPGARRELYDLLVIPGAEVTQNHIRSKKNSHIVALNIKEYISADQPADEILRGYPPAGRAQHRVPSASPHDAADRDQHLLPLGPPQAAGRSGRRVGSRQPRRSVFGDQPEALSRTSRTATSTSRSTCIRGRRCCAPKRPGRRSPPRSARTSISR